MKYWICAYSEKYKAQAKVLRDSVERHMPEYLFVAQPGLQSFEQAARARLGEAVSALANGAQEVIISGADCYVTSHFELPKSGNCLFTPHAFRLPDDSQCHTFMRGGLINSDFQVWRQGALPFLEKMLEMISTNKAQNIFEEEQAWLPLALSCAQGELIQSRDIGVAYYNLHEREILPRTKLIHFSGWDKSQPERFTKYPMPRDLTEYEQSILREYAMKVKEAE